MPRATVITVSDSCARGEREDRSGPEACRLLRELGFDVTGPIVVPDDRARIAVALRTAAAASTLVISTGGTGLAARDVTPEALEPMLDRTLPGFGELFRSLSFQEIGSAALLSRALAGTARGCVVAALPGSRAAIRLAMERLLLPELPHLAAEARKRA